MDELDKEFEENFKSWLAHNVDAEFLTNTENIKIVSKAALFGFKSAFGFMFERMEKAAESQNLGEFIKVIGTVMSKEPQTQAKE